MAVNNWPSSAARSDPRVFQQAASLQVPAACQDQHDLRRGRRLLIASRACPQCQRGPPTKETAPDNPDLARRCRGRGGGRIAGSYTQDGTDQKENTQRVKTERASSRAQPRLPRRASATSSCSIDQGHRGAGDGARYRCHGREPDYSSFARVRPRATRNASGGTTPWAVHDNFETSAKARFRRNIPTNTSKLCYGYGNCPYRERRKDLCREGVGGISPRDAFQQMFPPEGWVLTARVSQTLSVDVSGVVTD